jgi:Rrf2 family protein
MLTQTTMTAIQALLYMALNEREEPFAPPELCEHIRATPQYLSKIHTQLVKAGILTAHRGAKGGVTLARPLEQITLLDIVEASQGKILGDYCQRHEDAAAVCALHAAMHELQEATIAILSRWTLADLRDRPRPCEDLRPYVQCRLRFSGQ